MRKLLGFFLLLTYQMFIIGMNTTFDAMEWTWLYRKIFTLPERNAHNKKNEILFVKDNVPSFTQLLFCWNALRPNKGHFAFWVQVRDALSKQWSSWHKMTDWGNEMQRSYKTDPDTVAQFIHVRLEVLHNKKADAFALKMVSHEAPLSCIHAFSVNVSDFSRFKSEYDLINGKKLPSVYIPNVPLLSQFELNHPRNDGLCSPTSCTILTSYLMQKKIDPIHFAQHALDNGLDKYGSWPFNIAHAFECCKGEIFFTVSRLNSFTMLHGMLHSGIPVVVSVRGNLSGAPRLYANGHLLVVVGYDNQKQEVICHDPAAASVSETIRRYSLHDFVRAWEKSHRLAYLADPFTH